MKPEFVEFPKIARLSRECIITEKIDGTNAQIMVTEQDGHPIEGSLVESGGLALFAGSRNRWLSLESDNFGFAKWAHDHAEELLTLPIGRHFGEWWGQGIQRSYGLKEKRFSMFNVIRFCLTDSTPELIPSNNPKSDPVYQNKLPPCVGIVPLLWRGTFSTEAVSTQIERLRTLGSVAAPGFMKPEGIVVFHVAGNVGFKKTLEKDESPKNLR